MLVVLLLPHFYWPCLPLLLATEATTMHVFISYHHSAANNFLTSRKKVRKIVCVWEAFLSALKMCVSICILSTEFTITEGINCVFFTISEVPAQDRASVEV